MFKKILSMLLVVTLVLSTTITAGAQSVSLKNQMPLNDCRSNLKILQQTESLYIYTFNENNKQYKYIDTLENKNHILTKKYILKNNKYTLYDEVDFNITKNHINISSNKTNIKKSISLEEIKRNLYSTKSHSKSHDWEYQGSGNGNTRIKDLSLLALTAALTAITSGGVAVVAAANAIYAANVKTLYYKVKTYKDLNSPRLRPVFKIKTYWYLDEDHTERPDVKYTEVIIGKNGTH